MAVQVINDPYRSLSGSIGASLGTGLGQGLQALAQHKIDELQRQVGASNLKKLFPDITAEQAAGISAQPESIQKEYFKQKLGEPSQQEALKLLQQYYDSIAQGQGAQDQTGLAALQQKPVGPKPLIAPGISSEKALDLMQKERQEQRAQKEFGLKEQKDIQQQNVPFRQQTLKNKDFTKGYLPAARRALGLLKSGKVVTGLGGGMVPGALLTSSPESGLYDKEIAEVVVGLSNALKGNATNLKIKKVEEGKVSRTDPVETQKKRLQEIIDQGEEAEIMSDIEDRLITENNEREPRNLKAKVTQEYNKYDKYRKEAEKKYDKYLPNPYTLQPGSKIRFGDGLVLIRDEEGRYVEAKK